MTKSFGAVLMPRIRLYHPRVGDDLASAVEYYGSVSGDLANRFRDSIRSRLESITDYPESYGCIHEQIRVAMTGGFPYVILFEHDEEVVFILGIFHASSDQRGWFERSF